MVQDFPADSSNSSVLHWLTGERRRQVAPELQLFVSQLPSSSLELPLCRLGLVLHSLGLGLVLSRLPNDRLFNREIDPLRLGKELWKPGRDPVRQGTDAGMLEREPFGFELEELLRVDREPLSKGEDWRRTGGSSSWSLNGPEKTGQDAVEEQEPRSCRVEAALDLGWRRRVAMSIPFFPLLRTAFGDPFCTDSSLRPSSEMDTHKWTMSGSAELISNVFLSSGFSHSHLSALVVPATNSVPKLLQCDTLSLL